MKRRVVYFIIAMMSIVHIKAQIVSGTVLDGNNEPVEFATVVLQTPDSVYVNSTYTDSLGTFRIHSDLKSFRLIIQHLMYQPYESVLSEQAINTIVLENKDNILNEVVVSGERPVMKVINGRMTYDMPLLLKDKMVNNAYESLLELPGVSERDGRLDLAGASSLTVVLNGKPTTMTTDQLKELLKNTPKERVQNVEVMYSAPPQYHVRGSVINLNLTGGISESPTLQGQVNGEYAQYHNANYKLGASLLYGNSKFSTDFMYSFGYRENISYNDLNSKHLYEGVVYDIMQENMQKSVTPSHNFRLGGEYHLNDKNRLDWAYTSQITPWTHSLVTSNGSYSDSRNRKEYDRPVQMHNIALNYQSGFGLSVGGDYTYYTNHTMQHYEENAVGLEDAFNSLSKQDINRLSVYADQSHQLGNDWGLNYGAKFNYALDNSSQQYFSLTGEDMTSSDSKANSREYTYNVYAGFDKSFSEELSLSLSLAGEYYKFKDYDEWSIFPSMELTYRPNPSHVFQMSLSTDKSYPEYWEMMSSISYMNAYTEIHGNPGLRPSNEYSLQINYILKSKYSFGLYASHEDNYFVQLPYQSPDRLKLIYKTTNFNYSRQLGFNISLPFKVGQVLSSRMGLNGFYHNDKSDNFNNLSFDKKNFALFASLRNTFNISNKPNIKAELNGMYITPNIQGPSELSKFYRVDAGIKWTFANNNAEIQLKANDIFNSSSIDLWKMKYDAQNIEMHIQPNSRNINLSFTYKFGNYKAKQYKNVDTSRFKD